MTPKTTEASIYDFPAYYDLIFGSDWAAEYRFLTAAFDKHVIVPKGKGKVKRLLEPAAVLVDWSIAWLRLAITAMVSI